jgi:tetratricopeptide (TPR) repeat protein
MSESDMEDTQPTPVNGDTQPTSVTGDMQPAQGDLPSETNPSNLKSNRFPRWLVAAIILVFLIIGSLAGYGLGMGQRYDAQSTQVSGQLQEQFDLGLAAMDAGRYEVAQSHFDFIIENDPNFPGVMDAYADLLIRMQTSPTPTLTPTPTITPTPDLRSVEAIYGNVRSALTDRDWDAVLVNLDSLRKTDPNYRSAEVDGLYYLALRMRGVGKIILQEGETCPDINLEGGIYDLTLAARFGTLDATAESLRTYARLYIIGSSYWDLDWALAQNFFEQVMQGNPNLRDSSCMSAIERWRFATIERAKLLLSAGDTCGAEEQFNLAFTISSQKNEEYYPTATEVSNQCNGNDGGGEEPPATEGTPTLTPTGTETPTDTPPTP